ncbi:3-phosphoshikimate 1-carboxyvinyltransferase [Desulfosarcina sp. OttesenSCG-928-G10]|nr:3-phosphoshikimate 1-carboxyvinyltransferase [Desulfosarcina sp. OttesenSCG-928-G10]
MIEITPYVPDHCRIRVPGSKSETHRVFIAAALAKGVSTLYRPLRSQDTDLTLSALENLGAEVEEHGSDMLIKGVNGRFSSCAYPLYLANSGTSMRLLAGVVALGEGSYTLTGTERMYHRPIGPLIDALNSLNIGVRYLEKKNCPPLAISGGVVTGGTAAIDCSKSSQFLSSLLLMAPCTQAGMTLTVSHGPVSKPYVDMTVEVMRRFGITVHRDGYRQFDVPGGQTYQAGAYTIAPDASQAGYFWGAAAITGGTVTVEGFSGASLQDNAVQGDAGLVRIFQQMGCRVKTADDGITVTGAPLRSVTVDMADMPDMVPTLAVVAAFARGTTVMENIAHLRAKESDRLLAVCTELEKMGIEAVSGPDWLRVTGGVPRGAEIDTWNDHRMAMAFSMAGLAVPGIKIKNPECVDKSFPDFWNVWQGLYTRKA